MKPSGVVALAALLPFVLAKPPTPLGMVSALFEHRLVVCSNILMITAGEVVQETGRRYVGALRI